MRDKLQQRDPMAWGIVIVILVASMPYFLNVDRRIPMSAFGPKRTLPPLLRQARRCSRKIAAQLATVGLSEGW
jgi:hypothetical protein